MLLLYVKALMMKVFYYCCLTSLFTNAPPSFSMDSIASPKVKTAEGKGIGARSLACNILGVEGRAGALGWD